MVLCPFVYLQLRHDLPPLRLQPTEVHSAHWVSLRTLISPSLRRDVRCDVSERFARHRTPILRLVLRAILGQLVFGAVKLKPTESLYSRPDADIPLDSHNSNLLGRLSHSMLVQSQSDADDPLLLWGLTLGIMADLLEVIDRPATSKLWSWPTFSPWDIRSMIWILNRSYRYHKLQELTSCDNLDTRKSDGVSVGGLDNTTYSSSVTRRSKGSEAGVTGMLLLADYTDRLRRAVAVALFLRLVFGTCMVSFYLRKYRGYFR